MCLAVLCIVVSHHVTGSYDATDFKRLDGLRRVVRYFRTTPSESQLPTIPDPTLQSPPISTTPAIPFELWEADLITLLRVGKAGARFGQEKVKAQYFADRFDAVCLLENGCIKLADHRPRPLTMRISSSKQEHSI